MLTGQHTGQLEQNNQYGADDRTRDNFRAAGADSARVSAGCPHAGARVIGWCRQCDAMVEAGGYLPG